MYLALISLSVMSCIYYLFCMILMLIIISDVISITIISMNPARPRGAQGHTTYDNDLKPKLHNDTTIIKHTKPQ